MREELKKNLEGLLEIFPTVMDLSPNRIAFSKAVADEKTRSILEQEFIGQEKYRNLMDVHKYLTSVKNEVLDAILDCFPEKTAGWRIAGQVNEMLQPRNLPNIDDYCDSLSLRLAARNQEKDSILNISTMLDVSPDHIVTNKSKGANEGYILTDNEGTRHYIKNFSNDAKLETKGKLDPNEAFVYKVMEHMGLGPETKFLIRRYSTGRGTATSGNYIMTKDVCTPVYPGEVREFFLDEVNHKEIYAAALRSKEANVELSVLSAINDIMILGDTFGDNPKNYGIVRSQGDKGERYSVMMVDHLPNSNNMKFPPHRFAETETYSPRTSIQKRINSPHYTKDDVAITKEESPIEEGRRLFVRNAIKDDINSRMSGFPEALRRAREEVEHLITDNERSFVDGARERLGGYFTKIEENFTKYQEIEQTSGRVAPHQ